MKRWKQLVCYICICFIATALMNVDSLSVKGNRDWNWPVSSVSTISSCYGDGRQHYAIDIPCYNGTDIEASYKGKVIAVNKSCTHNYKKKHSCKCGKGLGNYVYILHSYNGVSYVSRYAHLSSVSVKVGDKVKKGQVIGESGCTGYSKGFHLDFRIYKGKSADDDKKSKKTSIDPFKCEFLELPSGFSASASTTCCYSYVKEVKKLYKKSGSKSVVKKYKGKYPSLPKRGFYMLNDGIYTLTSKKDRQQIKYIQKILNCSIGANLTVDGCYGYKTVNAVMKFQKKYGLVVDGGFGQNTLRKAKSLN